jgi:coenzyme F420-reducing hydrogenase beta subunit
MIDKLIKKPSDCTGCYACYAICPKNCISMDKNSEGFSYPHIDEKECINCGLCDNVCPIINKKEIQNTPKAYACINNNEEIRLESSSGGIFSLIAEYVIDNKGIVFGACFNETFEVVHDYIEDKKQIKKFRGSKYVQSKIGDTFKQAKLFLQVGRVVLFSGTPCQIGGLRSYLDKTYDNLICIDIICHGVPSPDVWDKYIKYREKQANSKTTKVSFKNKKNGWHKSYEYFGFKNNTIYTEPIDKDLYLKSFLNNICLRPSCYECEYKSIHRESDITIADFWGIEKVLPEMDDNKGTSAVFINNNKGEKIFNKIKPYITFAETRINTVVLYNSSAIKSANSNPKRKAFMKNKDKYDFDKLVKKYCTVSLYARSKSRIKYLVKCILKRSLLK